MSLYAVVENGEVTQYPYSLYNLKVDNPNISFPTDMSVIDLEKYNIVEVVEVPEPPIEGVVKSYIATTPVFDGTNWVQGWDVIEYTAEELAERIPSIVTMRQARLALFKWGILATVDSALNGLPEPDRTKAQIEWEYSGSVDRNSILAIGLAASLSLTETQLDDLFTLAAQL